MELNIILFFLRNRKSFGDVKKFMNVIMKFMGLGVWRCYFFWRVNIIRK